MRQNKDRENMSLAIEQARECRSGPRDPWVGAVAVRNGQLLGSAFRGELGAGDHAEFTLLEKKLQDVSLARATVYTTLEPCTQRNPDKTPCVRHLIARKVARVVIGMLDPNPIVCGRGIRLLREAGIVVDLFPHDLMEQLEELNRTFIRSIENSPIFQPTSEIVTLSSRSMTPLQQEVVGTTIKESLTKIHGITRKPTDIPGNLAGYLRRFVELIDVAHGTEHVQAFIRLTSYDADGLCASDLEEDFYTQAEDRAKSGKLIIDYMFLLNEVTDIDRITRFLDQIRRIAARISFLYQSDPRATPDLVGENIVLFRKQHIAFTHNRDEQCNFTGAREWNSPDIFQRLEQQYRAIEQISIVKFEAPQRKRSLEQAGFEIR